MEQQNTTNFPPEESLKSFFSRLIAANDKVKESDISVDYIRKKREESLYPYVRINHGSDYGGYEHLGLISLSTQELNLIGSKVEDIMQDIYQDKDLTK
ncbi:MAG: hypothetical protein ACYC6G_19465 [Desulfobaccales bacterium]